MKALPNRTRYLFRVSLGAIRIVNARQHNLKGITVELPHRQLVVVTGPSGSGKSSLAFDTLYAEGQRRYIESLSTYAKQFLERMPKPAVDLLEGLAPAVAIEQRNPVVSSRSTVGTATEVYDYLRVLWARIGKPFCRKCGSPVVRDTPASVVEAVLGARSRGLIVSSSQAARFRSVFPFRRPSAPRTRRWSRTSSPSDSCASSRTARSSGSTNCRRDWTWTTRKEILVVVDRLADWQLAAGSLAASRSRSRPRSAKARGSRSSCTSTGSRLRFTEFLACSNCDTPCPAHHPRPLLASTIPRGACGGCNGFGAVLEYDESLIVPDPRKSLAGGAIHPWTMPRYEKRRKLLVETAKKLGAASQCALVLTQGDGHAASCCTGRRAGSPESSPSSRAWRRSGTSSTSGSSCGATSSRRSAPRVMAPGSTRARCR